MRTIQVAVIGGTVSEVAGGKFGNGAVTAAFADLFNAQLHRYGKEFNVSKSEIESIAPVNLTDNYHARVEFRGGEIHVYKYEGGRLREIAVYQEGHGYVQKHGITAGPPDLPKNVDNRLKSVQIEYLRAKYPNVFEKERFSLKGLNTTNLLRAGKVIGIFGTINMLNSHHRACALDPGFDAC